jgi:basic membrane protein A
MEQAYHLAGYAAALKTKTKRLGFVGSYITPEVVRHINAFTIGAHRVDPSIVVEVRWVGFWFDTTPNPPPGYVFAETRLTQELLATGCDVIAHNVDNGRPVEAVEKAFSEQNPVYSVGNDNQDACVKGPKSCIGTSYWNWGPLYVRLLDEMHKGTWDPKKIVNDNIGLDPTTSIVNFGVQQSVAGSDVSMQVATLLGKLAAPDGVGKAFEGKLCSTGQRMPNCVNDGAKEITDQELATMCWFVEGVIEKTDPLDPMSADKAAQVPSPDCQNSL